MTAELDGDGFTKTGPGGRETIEFKRCQEEFFYAFDAQGRCA